MLATCQIHGKKVSYLYVKTAGAKLCLGCMIDGLYKPELVEEAKLQYPTYFEGKDGNAGTTKDKNNLIWIWAPNYEPFILGGNVNAPMSCAVQVEGRVNLGRGYKGFLVKSPKTEQIYVVEAETGAIVGSDLKMVQDDIKHGEKKVIIDQMTWAREEMKKAKSIAPETFWGKMAARAAR